MLFDKVAGFVERNIPKMVTDLEQTALFEFPFRAHEAVAPGRFCQDDLDRFFLPFPRTAIEELLLINSDTTYFIFEKSPAKPRQSKTGRITRSPDRSRYIPLKPEAIRRVMGMDRSGAECAGVKRPHERRRHWRLLSSDRYKHKHGQRVVVDACWVGPTEAVIGKTRYRVRLDIQLALSEVMLCLLSAGHSRPLFPSTAMKG